VLDEVRKFKIVAACASLHAEYVARVLEHPREMLDSPLTLILSKSAGINGAVCVAECNGCEAANQAHRDCCDVKIVAAKVVVHSE